MELAKPEGISLGQSGANIGIVIGRPVGAEREMGLETRKLGPVYDKSY